MIAVFSFIAMVHVVGQGVIMRHKFIVKGLKIGKEKFDVLRGSNWKEVQLLKILTILKILISNLFTLYLRALVSFVFYL
jgi:hypothetical protein